MENNIELFQEAYFGKSFMMIGKDLQKCYNCIYCRVDREEKHDFSRLLPTDLNKEFNKIPVAVNIFYGDPMIQIDETLDILERLEKYNHTGPVIIITKGDLTKFPKDRKFNLDIHFGISTFGVDSKFDGGSMKRFLNNLDYAKELGYKYSIEFRPIIKNINDSKEVIENIINIANIHSTGIGYCGLQMPLSLKERLKEEGIEFESYEHHQLGMKKYLPDEIHNIFQEYPYSFKKTSCLIAWKHNLDRDPNAHYYRPNEVGCFKCPMMEKCFNFKKSLSNEKLKIDIPFDYEIVHKDKHICGLFKLGVCKFPSDDCRNINGNLIKINEKITTTDVRLIKWLTGYTVDADFFESPYMSKKWLF